MRCFKSSPYTKNKTVAEKSIKGGTFRYLLQRKGSHMESKDPMDRPKSSEPYSETQ